MQQVRTGQIAVALASLLGFLPAVSTTASAQASCPKMMEVKIQEWTGDIINLVPWVAANQGIFTKHCVDVKFVPIVSGPASLSASVAGAINFHSGGPDGIMRARARGLDIRLIGNMYAAQWSTLVGRNGLQLPNEKSGYPAIMQDLVGKKIGVTAVGGTTEAFMRSSLEGAGQSGSSVTYVAVGGVTTAVPALKNAVVDAAMMFGTGPDLAEALGAGRIILDLRKKGVGPAVLQDMWGATLSWSGYGPFIEKNPEAVAAFTAANNEAVQWILDKKNRNAVYAIVKKHMPIPSEVPDADATLKRIVDVNADGLSVGIPKGPIDAWNKYLISLKQLEKPIPYDELVWTSGRP